MQKDEILKKVGLGTWAFGGRAYGPMEDNVSRDVIANAFALGVRFFDTAHIYAAGRSEELLGEGLKGQTKAMVCTKLGYDISSGKPVKNYNVDFLEKSLNESLQRLQRQTIDLLLLHNPPTEVLERPEVYSWLNEKVEGGSISKWGVSVYDSIHDATLALDAGAQAIEARYSLLRRDVIDELPENKWNFEFIARSPLDGGILSGKYKGDESFPKTDQRSAFKQDYFESNNAFLNGLRPLITNGTVTTLAELALRFVAFHSRVSKVIPGAKSLVQLEENVASVLKGPLPESAIKLINQTRQRHISNVLG